MAIIEKLIVIWVIKKLISGGNVHNEIQQNEWNDIKRIEKHKIQYKIVLSKKCSPNTDDVESVSSLG